MNQSTGLPHEVIINTQFGEIQRRVFVDTRSQDILVEPVFPTEIHEAYTKGLLTTTESVNIVFVTIEDFYRLAEDAKEELRNKGIEMRGADALSLEEMRDKLLQIAEEQLGSKLN